jgi:hypothetical protein
MIGAITAGTLSGGVPPIPITPVAGYFTWLDAADTSTITKSGSAVSQWTDKSANAFAFTQATSAYKPDSGLDTQNGKNVLTWGVNDRLVNTAASSNWKFLHYDTGTIFVAFKQTVAGNSAGIMQTNGASSVQTGFYIFHQATSKIQHQVSFSSSGNTVVNNNTDNNAVDTNFTYLTILSDPRNATAANRSDIRVKQGSAIKNNTQTNAAANTNPTNTLSIGDYQDAGGIAINGTVGEIIIYNSILSAGDILLNQQYLANKWGV